MGLIMAEFMAVVNLIVYIAALGAAIYHTWKEDYSRATFYLAIVIMCQHGFSNG